MSSKRFHIGDPVVYRKTKHSTNPGPRAVNVYPSRHGDDYCYEVDKYWLVVDESADDKLVLVTRTGKRHIVAADDPRLRHANWYESLILRNRFPSPDKAQA